MTSTWRRICGARPLALTQGVAAVGVGTAVAADKTAKVSKEGRKGWWGYLQANKVITMFELNKVGHLYIIVVI